ncbi:MAG: gamma-glutamyl-gamma-aminobutyrate hydrolase family protein [Candidatus Kapabacteria bacterium]|nr:gamma-glutamyl-gamma-aminobutyrate hydrolase family protein [Candidatus Kapabacteria bacterium]
MKIAISKASGGDNYDKCSLWLKAADADVQIVNMIELTPQDAVLALRECNGLLLSGGPDVDPQRYNEPEKRSACGPIDLVRDELEFALVKEARELSLPVLGVCRGAQLLNVAYGGTLYADIPTAHPSNIEHRQIDSVDSSHAVHVEPGSIIRRIAGVFDAQVNSAHHQAVEKLATIFTPSALSPDGLIEAFEWGDATMGGKPFLLAVQWHPERMEYDEPLSLNIARHFLHEADAYSVLIRR